VARLLVDGKHMGILDFDEIEFEGKDIVVLDDEEEEED